MSKSLKEPNLLDEYLILCRLNHQNIVKVYDYFEVQEKEYMFLELCETILVDEYKKNDFQEKSIISIIKQILKAI